VVWPLYWIAFLGNLSIGAPVLIIPLKAGRLGQSPATIGLLYAAFASLGAFASRRRGCWSTAMAAAQSWSEAWP